MTTEIYFLRSTRERGDELLEAGERFGSFAEAVDDDLHRRGGPPIPCLLSFIQGKITHSGTLFVGNKAAEGSKRVNVGDIDELVTPIRTGALVDRVPAALRRGLQDRLRGGGLIDGDMAQALLEAIQLVDPSLAATIDRFERERRRIAGLSSRNKAALAIEKEMLGTALSFAGFSREEMRGWTMPEDSEASFLDGLDRVRLREDAMVANDMRVVPGFEFVRPVAKSAAQFRSGDVRLTVVLANHLAIEEQLGADLIYYNEAYRAFTIIQYKAMERGDMHTALFRLPNAKLAEEIGRMRTHLEALRGCPPNAHCEGYRLLENPFYLKLCPRIDFEPGDVGLVKGMYLPLDYWDLIEADPRKSGPRGGRQVTFENVGRYFDNTSFISLVATAGSGRRSISPRCLRQS